MKITDNYVFFWKAYIGNWSKTPNGLSCIIHGKQVLVPTSEHLFMTFKAEFFQDFEILEKIIQTNDPKIAKNLGRQVKNFNQTAWNNVCFDLMLKAITIRFNQDQKFANEIMSEKYIGKEFVEASPFDKIWGIGMDESNPNIEDKSKWMGQNLLGKCFNSLRENNKSKEN